MEIPIPPEVSMATDVGSLADICKKVGMRLSIGFLFIQGLGGQGKVAERADRVTPASIPLQTHMNWAIGVL